MKNMQVYIYKLIIFCLSTIFLFSCSEESKELEASPDMLVRVINSGVNITLDPEDYTKATELKKEIENLLLNDSVCLYRDYVYEIKLDDNNSLDIYKSEKDFRKGKKLYTGSYLFKEDAMAVTFSFEKEDRTFTINGSLANVFYNHFVRKGGSGTHNIVEGGKVFCLHDDYTEILKEKYKATYPDVEIKLVDIQTDLMTMRSLETFK